MKALGVNMRLISLLFMISVMASAVQARVVATFDCKILSATALGLEEGRSTFFGKSDGFGKQVRLKITMQPDPKYDNWYEVKSEMDIKGQPIASMLPINSYDIKLINEQRLAGGTWHGGFELTSDTVQFFSNRFEGITLGRYYRGDWHGFLMLSDGSSTTWTHGLNCLSAKYNEQDFINFHNSWDK